MATSTLEAVQALRAELLTLKKDPECKKKFELSETNKQEAIATIIRPLYNKLLKALALRSPEDLRADTQVVEVTEQVLFMLSLGFLRLGFVKFPVGTYAPLATVHALLSKLCQSPLYTDQDVKMLSARISEYQEELRHPSLEEFAFNDQLGAIISLKIEQCQERLLLAGKQFHSLNDKQIEIQAEFVQLRREELNHLACLMANCAEDEGANVLQDNYDKLQIIRERLLDIQTIGPTEGGAKLLKAVEFSLPDFKKYITQAPPVEEKVADILPKLLELTKSFETILATHRWTLRQTDLLLLKEQLDEYNELVFSRLELDPETQIPALGFSVVLFLTRKARVLLFKILDAAEPVDEALVTIYNKLLTGKRCLTAVRDMGGVSDRFELYPYQMKLASIEKSRVDGVFVVNGEVPAGQSILDGLLKECVDLVESLKRQLEEREANQEPGEVEDEDFESDQSSDFTATETSALESLDASPHESDKEL